MGVRVACQHSETLNLLGATFSMRDVLSLVSFPMYYSPLCEKYCCRDQQQSFTMCPGAATPHSCAKGTRITAAADNKVVAKLALIAHNFHFQHKDGFNTDQIKKEKLEFILLRIVLQKLVLFNKGVWLSFGWGLFAFLFVIQINLQLTLQTATDFSSLLLY